MALRERGLSSTGNRTDSEGHIFTKTYIFVVYREHQWAFPHDMNIMTLLCLISDVTLLDCVRPNCSAYPLLFLPTTTIWSSTYPDAYHCKTYLTYMEFIQEWNSFPQLNIHFLSRFLLFLLFPVIVHCLFLFLFSVFFSISIYSFQLHLFFYFCFSSY